jgi:FkbM family methyltransferase
MAARSHLLRKFLFNALNDRLLVAAIHRMPQYKFSIKAENGHYFIVGKHSSLYISRPHRLFKYKSGIRPRLQEIADKYFLSQVNFSEGDIIIDVGANIGEMTLSIRNLIAPGVGFLSISIEPDPVEFSCLKLNLLKTDLVFQEFISDSIKLADVKFDNKSGDTHIIHDLESTGISDAEILSKIQVTTLDDLILDIIGLKSIKLLKVEVEGMEPEVLLGAIEILRRTENVAIDCGPERNGMDTYLACAAILEENGFTHIESAGRDSMLFRQILRS